MHAARLSRCGAGHRMGGLRAGVLQCQAWERCSVAACSLAARLERLVERVGALHVWPLCRTATGVPAPPTLPALASWLHLHVRAGNFMSSAGSLWRRVTCTACCCTRWLRRGRPRRRRLRAMTARTCAWRRCACCPPSSAGRSARVRGAEAASEGTSAFYDVAFCFRAQPPPPACEPACTCHIALLVAPHAAAGGSGVWRLLESGRPAAEAASLRPPAAWAEALFALDGWAWLGHLAHAVW